MPLVIGWSDLPSLLSWQEAGAYAALRSSCAAVVRLPSADDGAGVLDELPPAAARAVLQAPRTQACLVVCPPEHRRAHLVTAVVTERARAGLAWTAPPPITCDRCTLTTWDDDRGELLWAPLGDRSWQVTDHASWSQPELAPGVSLDVRGPAVLGALPDIPGRAAALRPEEVAEVRLRGGSAMAGLALAAPGAAELVTALTRTVVGRRDTTGPGHCGASSSLAIGQTVLRNPHAVGADPAWFAETLVHEAVHALLDVVQRSHPMLRDPESARSASVVSPWTGRSLDLDTYLQACWVWYAVTWTWGLLCASDDSRIRSWPGVRDRARRAAAGFTGRDVRAALAGRRDDVDPEVLRALGTAQARLGLLA